MKLPSFIRAVALITIFTVATRSIGFVFRIFLSRILGPEMLGVYQIALSFFMVFLTLIASGLPLIISKHTAEHTTNPKPDSSLKRIALSGLTISLSVSLTVLLFIFSTHNLLGYLFTDRRSLTILMALAPSLVAYSVYSVLRAIWWGQKRFSLLGLTELLEQLMRVGTFAVMLMMASLFLDMARLAAVAYSIASVFSAILVTLIFLKTTKKRGVMSDVTPQNTPLPKLSASIKPIAKSAAPITFVRFFATVALPIIAITVPHRLQAAGWTPAEALSAFGIAVGMTLPLLTIPQAIISSLATALVPELSSAVQNKQHDAVTKQVTNCLRFALLVNFLILPVFMSLGRPIGVFLFDNETSGIYLIRSAWIMIPMSLSLITNAILNSLGAETRAMKHYLLGSIALFASIWFLPAHIGIYSLMVGIGVCMSIASLLNIRMINKITGARPRTFGLISMFTIISIPAGLLGYFMHGLLATFLPLFFSIGFSAAITVATLGLLAYTLNLFDFFDYLKLRQKRIKNA